jgi:hypothetical protein
MIFQTDNTPGFYYNSGTSGTPNWIMVGSGSFTLPYTGSISIATQAFKITNTGSGDGIVGYSSSSAGKGIYGFATSATGINYGVYGATSSGSGYGVYGAGQKGVYGYSPYGIGVEGLGVHGIHGETNINGGWGVSGNSANTTGGGILGINSAAGGVAIMGDASSTSGLGKGVFGHSGSNEGYGVYGSNSTGGFSGYFEGGKFYISGYTGIGTEDPDCALNIQAPDNASRNMLRIENGTGNTKILMRQSSNGSGGFYVYNASEEITIFLYGDGPSYINSGNLGIGTTSPTQLLDVVGNARFRLVGSGGYNAPLNLTSDGTLTTASSDERLKSNINTLENSLEKVSQLRGVSFTWKEDPEMGERIGFIAQEVEKIYPELVFTNKTDGLKGVNYAEFSAVLVEAVKELKAENDMLKARLQEIEARLEKMAEK